MLYFLLLTFCLLLMKQGCSVLHMFQSHCNYIHFDLKREIFVLKLFHLQLPFSFSSLRFLSPRNFLNQLNMKTFRTWTQLVTSICVLQYNPTPLRLNTKVLFTDATLDLLTFLLARSLWKSTGNSGNPMPTFFKFWTRIYNYSVPFT